MEAMGKSITEANETGGSVGRTVDQATNVAHKAIDRASDATRPAVDRVAAGAHQTVDKIAGAANRAAETLEARGGQLRDAQSRFTESCSAYVRDNPIASLGLAVAAGFLLSRLLSSR